MNWIKKNSKSMIITAVMIAIAACALFGASYLMGSLIIDFQEVKPESVPLAGEVILFGYVILCVLYSGSKLIDFMWWVWEQVSKAGLEGEKS